jgi:hypothetical protein
LTALRELLDAKGGAGWGGERPQPQDDLETDWQLAIQRKEER